MIKSKIFVFAVLVVFVAFFAAGYFVYNSLFPVAEPIDSPHPDTVTSVTLKEYGKDEPHSIDVYTFYDYILNAKPTRIMSVNDYPDTRPYYEVILSCSDKRHYRYYLYTSGGRDYIEIPYVGVYKIANFKINDLIE